MVQKKLITLGCCILICCGCIGVSGQTETSRPQRKSREEMQAHITKELSLTEDQSSKMKEVMEDKELSRKEKMEKLKTFLTEEQQEKMKKMHEQRRARRAERKND